MFFAKKLKIKLKKFSFVVNSKIKREEFFFMRYLFFSFAVLICFFAYSGELEDFEDDVQFLRNSYMVVKKSKKNAPIKQEFTKRMFRAKARAAKLQQNLTKQGVHRVSLDSTLRKMLAFMPIDGINSRSLHNESGSLNLHYTELCNQINYLKEINYSPEKGTLENPYPASDAYDAVHRFESRFRSCASLAAGAGTVRPPVKKRYEENMNDLRRLAIAIERHIHETKFEVPAEFDLVHELAEFNRSAERSIAARLRKDSVNSKERKRMTSSKQYQGSIPAIKFRAERIQNAIDYLKKTNFDLRVRKTNLASISSNPSRIEDEITESSGKPSFEELWKRYSKKREALFNSESRIRGTSEEFYRKYRAILPPDQQKELDLICKKNIEQEMPPEFARSYAVKSIHTKYRFQPKSYSKEFLAGILKQIN